LHIELANYWDGALCRTIVKLLMRYPDCITLPKIICLIYLSSQSAISILHFMLLASRVGDDDKVFKNCVIWLGRSFEACGQGVVNDKRVCVQMHFALFLTLHTTNMESLREVMTLPVNDCTIVRLPPIDPLLTTHRLNYYFPFNHWTK